MHGFLHFCSKFSWHVLLFSLVWALKFPVVLWICLELRLGAVALTLCSLAYHPTCPPEVWGVLWMNRSSGRKIVSSEATEEEIHHIRTGTLDQGEAIALLRAFDPGAWVRIAFDVKSVASILRGEPFVRSVLQLGQTSQLMFSWQRREHVCRPSEGEGTRCSRCVKYCNIIITECKKKPSTDTKSEAKEGSREVIRTGPTPE